MQAKLPVVFLPGIMGSRLYYLNSQKYWDPDDTARMLQWAPIWPFRSADTLRRQMTARQPAGVLIDQSDDLVSGTERLRGWGGVVWSFYGPFLQDIQKAVDPAQVYAIGYDWRQNLWWLADYFRAKLEKVLAATGASQAVVTTHSMGGLVVRSAFAKYPDLKDKVRAVIFICQPCVGAVVLYRRMFTGLVRGLDGSGSPADRAFRLILGNNRDDFMGNMSGLPGGVQLLPAPSFPRDESGAAWNAFLDLGFPADQLYSNPASPPSFVASSLNIAADAMGELKLRLDELTAFHKNLGPPDRPETVHKETWLILGDGVPTETRTEFPGGVARAVQTERGDGVVPVSSATAVPVPPGRTFPVTGVTHSDACINAEVREHARTIIKSYVDDVTNTEGEADVDNDPFAGVPVIGKLPPQALAEKLVEIGVAPGSAAALAAVPAANAAAPPSFGIFNKGPTVLQPWQHTSHTIGFIAPGPPGQDLAIRQAGDMRGDPALKGAPIKITLDRLRVAAYPGGGIHRVLFDFSAQNQVAGGVENLHFNATYRIQEGEEAAVVGFPIFVGLNVGNEGVAFRAFTVNVQNDNDEAFLDLLDSDIFKAGLQLATVAQPAVAPFSALAVGLTKSIAKRNRNVPVQDVFLGLDFSNTPTRARLAEGSYLVVQAPEAETSGWDWSAWVYRPSRGQVVLKADPTQTIGYNYFTLGVSRCDPGPGSPPAISKPATTTAAATATTTAQATSAAR